MSSPFQPGQVPGAAPGAPAGSRRAPGLPTPPKGWPVGSYPTYAEAQRAVDYLSDQQFPVQQVTIVVSDTYRFDPDVITVHPGKVKITLMHTGTGAPHDLSVLGFPADFVPLVQPGGTSSATFIAPAPGSYKFVCTIHVTQGQTGTLIVLAN